MAKVVWGQFSHNRECLCARLYSEPRVECQLCVAGQPCVLLLCAVCLWGGSRPLKWWSLLNSFIASFRRTHCLHFPRQRVNVALWLDVVTVVYLWPCVDFSAQDSALVESLIASLQSCVTKCLLQWTDTDADMTLIKVVEQRVYLINRLLRYLHHCYLLFILHVPWPSALISFREWK